MWVLIYTAGKVKIGIIFLGSSLAICTKTLKSVHIKKLSILEHLKYIHKWTEEYNELSRIHHLTSTVINLGSVLFHIYSSIFPHLYYVEANSSYIFFLKKLFYVIILSLHLYFNFISKHNIHTEMCCSSNFTK